MKGEDRDNCSPFAILAIFVSCMGIFGLASFTAEKRTKEIGIRKVLGASVSGIVILLSKEFVKWVLVANIIGWPVAYFNDEYVASGFCLQSKYRPLDVRFVRVIGIDDRPVYGQLPVHQDGNHQSYPFPSL